MEEERSPQNGRLASLAQVGLAALVAGTLLTFSSLAFRAAFDDNASSGQVTAQAAGSGRKVQPVVLPSTEPADTVVEVDRLARDETVVLGTRIRRATVPTTAVARPAGTHNLSPKSVHTAGTKTTTTDSHEHHRGKGHIKARGKGHHKDHHDGHGAHGSGEDDRSYDQRDHQWLAHQKKSAKGGR